MRAISPYLRLALAQVVLSVGVAACASVETVRFTGEQYPAKSPGDVQALSDAPNRPYRAMAELRLSETDAASLRQKIVEKAAGLGADAVIFAKPETHKERRLLYGPVAGQVNAEIPYDITVTSLRGIAIKYLHSSGSPNS
jgi:hypothetical protein